jgi:hypothetical protein
MLVTNSLYDTGLVFKFQRMFYENVRFEQEKNCEVNGILWKMKHRSCSM